MTKQTTGFLVTILVLLVLYPFGPVNSEQLNDVFIYRSDWRSAERSFVDTYILTQPVMVSTDSLRMVVDRGDTTWVRDHFEVELDSFTEADHNRLPSVPDSVIVAVLRTQWFYETPGDTAAARVIVRGVRFRAGVDEPQALLGSLFCQSDNKKGTVTAGLYFKGFDRCKGYVRAPVEWTDLPKQPFIDSLLTIQPALQTKAIRDFTVPVGQSQIKAYDKSVTGP